MIGDEVNARHKATIRVPVTDRNGELRRLGAIIDTGPITVQRV